MNKERISKVLLTLLILNIVCGIVYFVLGLAAKPIIYLIPSVVDVGVSIILLLMPSVVIAIVGLAIGILISVISFLCKLGIYIPILWIVILVVMVIEKAKKKKKVTGSAKKVDKKRDVKAEKENFQLDSDETDIVLTLIGEENGKIYYKNRVESEILIGRDEECDVALKVYDEVSRVHCKIKRVGVEYYLQDLKSTNGTYVGKMKLQPGDECQLLDGMNVRVANVKLQIKLEYRGA